MGRNPCCSKEEGLNRGAWTAQEDKILTDYIKVHGEGKWRNLPKNAGLKRCGKSCRLRWLNYLRPDIKRGNISHDEEELIIRLHKLLGNRWSLIAGRLPGRTDNEIKNYWNTNIGKKLQDQQSPSPSSRKPSNFCQEKPNIRPEQSNPEPAIADIDSFLVQTKASKYNKMVISSPPELSEKFDQDQLIDTKEIMLQPSMANGFVHELKEHESSPRFNLEQNNSSDFMTDFEMDLLSFLNTDFSQITNFDNNNVAGDGSIANNTYDTGYLSPDSDKTVMFSELKKLNEPDFPLMDSIIGSEFEWF